MKTLVVIRGKYFYFSRVGQHGLIFFLQKYSYIIYVMVYCAKILVRYCYMLHGHHDFLFGFDQKKTPFLGFVQKYYFFWGSCRNITVPSYCITAFLCRALLRGCAEILFFGEIFTSVKLCPIWKLWGIRVGGGRRPLNNNSFHTAVTVVEL